MKEAFKKFLIYILQIESRLVLWKYQPKVVAITGSVGKTSTKDAVYAVLSGIAHVRKSEKSYNSEIGLPLTILGCSNGWNNPFIWLLNILKGFWLFVWPHKYPSWLVLEVGVGKPGDMKRTASWLKTDAVIMTAIGGETPAHIEFFASRKHLIEEKSGLIKTLKKDGILVLNTDDEAIYEMKDKTRQLVVTYGFKEDADIVGSGDSILYDDHDRPSGIIFRVDDSGSSFPVVIEGVFGRNHIYAALAALGFASGLKLNMLSATNMLKSHEVPAGRMRLLQGINNSLIIDDTYNSSPFACQSALQTLKEVKHTGRKIAILGDMLELGKHTDEAHKNIGKVVQGSVDILVVVGPRSQFIKVGALEAGFPNEQIFEFANSKEVASFMKNFVKEGDLILVKGSQGMRMERVVGAIVLDDKNKEKLLVRHDTNWLNKE